MKQKKTIGFFLEGFSRASALAAGLAWLLLLSPVSAAEQSYFETADQAANTLPWVHDLRKRILKGPIMAILIES